MMRTEKLLAELIALPSVNPAFAPHKSEAPRDGAASDDQRFVQKKFDENAVADFLASVAAKAGLEVDFHDVQFRGRVETSSIPGFQSGLERLSPHLTNKIDCRRNLIVRLLPRSRTRQTILLAPHLDTVPAKDSQFVPRRKHGRLYGRGACDTKGTIAAMLTALCELADSKSRPEETEIIFAGLIDEEHAQAGSRALVKSKLKAHLAIVGEPTRLQVVTAHKGSLWLELETRGKAAHGATPQFGRNAIHEMARVVDWLQTDYAALLRKRKHSLLGMATVNVGMICGGTQPNIVPDHCTITIDRRTLPGETDAGVRREIAAFLASKGFRAPISSTKLAPALPLETNAKLPLVRQFLLSIGQTRPAGVDFFCDAAVLSAGGIPSVVFGPGDIAQAHTADEWISLAELERGKNLLLKFLASLP